MRQGLLREVRLRLWGGLERGLRLLLSVVLKFEVFDEAGEDEAQGISVVPGCLGSMMVREIKCYG